MINTCSAQRSVTALSQQIIYYLRYINQFNDTAANQLISDLESIRGQVREFPVNIVKKQPILEELDLIENILRHSLGIGAVAELVSALQILDVIRSKIEDLSCC